MRRFGQTSSRKLTRAEFQLRLSTRAYRQDRKRDFDYSDFSSRRLSDFLIWSACKNLRTSIDGNNSASSAPEFGTLAASNTIRLVETMASTLKKPGCSS